jgi:hypothetical protein
VAYIQYGLPSDLKALEPDLDAGHIVLGGCTVGEDFPQWRCLECRHEWGITELAAEFEQIRLKCEAEDRAEDDAALARGVLEARVNSNGFAKCPYCGYSFSTQRAMSWDGEKHKSCKTRLRLIYPQQE